MKKVGVDIMVKEGFGHNGEGRVGYHEEGWEEYHEEGRGGHHEEGRVWKY